MSNIEDSINDFSDKLMYSYDAENARYFLYEGINDINIFVEDKNREYEYETIFKRLLMDNYTNIGIYAVDGKENLKKKFFELGITDNANPQIKNIYIADGDFDRYIKPEEMIESPNFIYLETYNIENYYIDEEEAIATFIKGRLKCLDHIVKEKLNFSYWMSNIILQSHKLFLLYCTIEKFHNNKSIPTVSRSVGKFIDFNTGFEREDGAYEKLLEEIKEIDIDILDKIQIIHNIYQELHGNNYFYLICGKFLFTSLCCYIRNIISSKFDHNDFKWYLINNFDVTKLNYIKYKIIQIQQE